MGQKANLFWDAASNSTRTIKVQRLLTWFTPMFYLSEHRSLQRESPILGIWNMLETTGTVPQEVTFWPRGLKLLPEITAAAETWIAAAELQPSGSTASNCLQQRFLFLRCFSRETHYPAGTTMTHFPVSSLPSHHSSSCLTQHEVTACKDFTFNCQDH